MSVNKNKLVKSIQTRGGYSIYPNEIWELPISFKAKTMFLYLLGQSDSWNPGMRAISDILGMGRDSITLALQELADSNMLEISKAGQGMRQVYHINGMEEWNIPSKQVALSKATSDENWPYVGPPLALSKATTGPNEGHVQEESKKNPTASVENSKSKPSPEQIYRSWLSQLPEVRYESCVDELMILFATLQENGYGEDSISSSLKKKVLNRWAKSKYPQRIEEWYEQALGSVFGAGLTLATPDAPKTISVHSKKSEKISGEITMTAALELISEDDEIERMMKEFERIRNGEEQD